MEIKYIVAGLIHFAILLTFRAFLGFEVAVLYGIMSLTMEVVKIGITIKS